MLKHKEGSANTVATPGSVGVAPKVTSRVGAPWVALPIPESLSQPTHGKWMRAKLWSPMPGPSTLKRQVVGIEESAEEVGVVLVPGSELAKKRLGSLRDQLNDTRRDLEHVQWMLEAAQKDGEGWQKEAEEMMRDYERVKKRLVAQQAKVAELS
jgi:hypothetical protein